MVLPGLARSFFDGQVPSDTSLEPIAVTGKPMAHREFLHRRCFHGRC